MTMGRKHLAKESTNLRGGCQSTALFQNGGGTLGAPPGSPVTAVPYGEQFALFITDPSGGIYTIGGTPDGGWGGWSLVPDPQDSFRAAPGSAVTAVPYGGQLALFVTSNSGEISTLLW